MLRLGHRQAIFPHTFDMQFDRLLNEALDILACVCDSEAPGEVRNTGAANC